MASDMEHKDSPLDYRWFQSCRNFIMGRGGLTMKHPHDIRRTARWDITEPWRHDSYLVLIVSSPKWRSPERSRPSMWRTRGVKSAFGKSVNYALNHKEGLSVYLNDGNAALSNNICERAIRNFIIGCKNWPFSASPKGATASAAVYSVVETCKANTLTHSNIWSICLNRYQTRISSFILTSWMRSFPRMKQFRKTANEKAWPWTVMLFSFACNTRWFTAYLANRHSLVNSPHRKFGAPIHHLSRWIENPHWKPPWVLVPWVCEWR